MAFTTLISTADLVAHMSSPNWLVVDCRYSLQDADLGRRQYLEGHIPGAVYADLHDDLSGPIVPGKTGRHPLPAPESLSQVFGRLGIGDGVQVVAYDASGGSTAARLWWMLRWLGHDDVAVLDGGWSAWQSEGRVPTSGEETVPARQFSARLRPELVVDAGGVASLPTGWRLLDSRSADRYRGENETMDPVAGHIPGAESAPYGENVDASGRFRPAAELRQRFEGLLEGTPAEETVFYCGSGVSAANNILALAHAGLGDARLYPGSWSEWITDPARPIATGESA